MERGAFSGSFKIVEFRKFRGGGGIIQYDIEV